MTRFCPKCGKEEGPFIKGFCKECYLSKQELIDVGKKMEIEKCKRCGRIRVSGKWMKQTAGALEEYVLPKIKINEMENAKIDLTLEQEGKDGILAIIGVKGDVGGEPLTLRKELLLKQPAVLCESCNRLVASYFEAILQVRLRERQDREKINKALDNIRKLLEIEKKSDSLAEIVNLASVNNGFDAYIGSKRAAKRAALALARKYKSRVVSSYEDKGRDRKGKPRKRFTFSVKI